MRDSNIENNYYSLNIYHILATVFVLFMAFNCHQTIYMVDNIIFILLQINISEKILAYCR